MKARWLLLGLAFALAGCQLGYLVPIVVEYTSKGVCSGVELTTRNPEMVSISVVSTDYSGIRGASLTPNQPVRIPDPNPPLPPDYEPRLTEYVIYFDIPVPSSIDADLTWRCLPDKEPLRARFTHSLNNPKALLITENPDSPHGFDIRVVDR